MIDDFFIRVWVHILKNKSDTFEKFKEWHILIENHPGTKLKVLRTNNDLKFVLGSCNKFCGKKVLSGICYRLDVWILTF